MLVVVEFYSLSMHCLIGRKERIKRGRGWDKMERGLKEWKGGGRKRREEIKEVKYGRYLSLKGGN